MGLVFILIEMDIYIMDNGKMIKGMEKVFYIIQMVKFMREILKRENLIFHYYNGNKFIGNFRNNSREGYGIKFTHDNSVIFAKYSNDKMKKSLTPNF